MDAQNFADLVRMSSPCVQEDTRQVAIHFFVDQGWTQQSDIASCIELAGRIEACWNGSQQNSGTPEGVRLASLTPGILAISDCLIKQITPDVEQVRQELFGNTEAPFSSYEAIEEWLEQMGQRQHYTVRHEKTEKNGKINNRHYRK